MKISAAVDRKSKETGTPVSKLLPIWNEAKSQTTRTGSPLDDYVDTVLLFNELLETHDMRGNEKAIHT